jgi:hypothetical protein
LFLASVLLLVTAVALWVGTLGECDTADCGNVHDAWFDVGEEVALPLAGCALVLMVYAVGRGAVRGLRREGSSARPR